MRQLAVIGDVGGHYDTFADKLVGLGVNVHTGHIPSKLHIVQVGDLVHKGPKSLAVVELVDRMLNGPCASQWTQVVGNHDAQLLGGTHFWEDASDAQTAKKVQAWWENNQMVIAAAYTTKSSRVASRGKQTHTAGAEGLLVTHAGLTGGAWELLGKPHGAHKTAEALNLCPPVAWREGQMVTGVYDRCAGPLWASSEELYRSWAGLVNTTGFSQAHGHSTPWMWSAGRWRGAVETLRGEKIVTGVIDRHTHIVHTRLATKPEMVVFEVDPGHGRMEALRWEPLLLELS